MPKLPSEKPQEPRQETPVVRLAIAPKQGGESDLNAAGLGHARSVRLALGAEVIKSVGEKALSTPTVRLAVTIEGGKETSPVGQEAMARHLGPNVRLAHVPGAQGDNNLLGQRGVEALPPDSRPALLVSYVYLQQFLNNKHRYHYRDWVMDSGAFSAFNSGEVINLQDYIDCAKKLLQEDRTLTEVFGLDVIGDWRAGLKNCEEMWKQGVEAIPTFHHGEPWDVLLGLAKDYPKIALGGCVGKKDKNKFAQQCFARVWPKRIHGFGFGSEKSLMLVPWHSVDATNWEIAPCKYGTWKAFGHQRVSVRGSRQNLRAEVEWYLDLERRARERWKKEMAKLGDDEALRPSEGVLRGPSIKMAIARLSDNSGSVRDRALGEPLTVRLVGNGDVVCQRQIEAFGKQEDSK